MRQRPLDGVIRSQRRVAQRRGCGRAHVAERYQQPRGRNQHVVRHSSVETDSAAEAIHLGPVLAIVLHRQLAGVAPTAAPRPVDRHGIPFFEPADTFSERGYPAGVFMTESEGRREAQVFLHHVQIRVAHASTADLDEYLSRTGCGLGNVLDLRGATNTNKSDRLHRSPPRSFSRSASARAIVAYCPVSRGGSMLRARSSAGDTIPPGCRGYRSPRRRNCAAALQRIDPSPFAGATSTRVRKSSSSSGRFERRRISSTD